MGDSTCCNLLLFAANVVATFARTVAAALIVLKLLHAKVTATVAAIVAADVARMVQQQEQSLLQ